MSVNETLNADIEYEENLMKIANKEIKVHAKKTKQNIEFQKNKDSLSS